MNFKFNSSIFTTLLVLCLSTVTHAESLYPCELEQYQNNLSANAPTVEQLHSDFKIAYNLGDKNLSLTILCRAAAVGSSEAEFMLGVASEEGPLRIKKNQTQARYWFHRAVKRGHLEAHYHLSLLYLEGRGGAVNSKKGIQLLHFAAQSNYAKAQSWLAYQYVKGQHLKRDLKKASYWANKAYENGYEHAKELIEIIDDINIIEQQK